MNKTVEIIAIGKANAMDAYELADEKLKPILAKLFGLEKTIEKWEDILTFEDACIVTPPTEDQQILLNYDREDKHTLAAQAFLKLSIISQAMNMIANGGSVWYPDWSNSSEYKYYAWPNYRAGSGFSDFDYVCDCTSTSVGSRLCFKSEAMVRHAFKQFQPLYNTLFTL